MATPFIYEDSGTTVISSCEATTNWTGPTAATDSELKKEGSNSLSFIVRSTSETLIYYAPGTLPDISSSHLRLWFNCAWVGVMPTIAGGPGVSFYVRDTSSNEGRWSMLGSDNYNGGWVQMLIDTSRSFDSTVGGAPNLASLDRIGIAVNQTSSPRRQVNTWIDRLEYNDGLTIRGGTSGDPITWDDIAAQENDSTGAWGVLVKSGDVYFARGRITFGDSTGDTYFKDTGKIVQFPDEKVASDLYTIQINSDGTQTTSVQMGESSGTGEDTLGFNGCIVGADGTQTWTLDCVDANIDTLKFYGCVFDNCDYVYFGDTTNNLGGGGSTIHLVDNVFSNGTQLIRAVDSSATLLQLRNSVVGYDDTNASVLITDDFGVDGNRLSVLNNDAFTSEDDGTSQTITVTDHDFSGNDLFIQVHNGKVWDVINPIWTVDTTNQSDIDFIGSDGTTEKVNEKYSLDVLVRDSATNPIGDAKLYVYEGLLNQNLPVEETTDSTTGEVSTNILKNIYTDGTTSLNTTSYGDFALKIYKYGYSPFVSNQAVTQAINRTIALAIDNALDATNSAQAIADGTSTTLTYQPGGQPVLLLSYDTGTTAFVVGDVVTGASSGADGTVTELVEGDSTSGRILLKNWDGTNFTNDEALQVSAATKAYVDLTTGGQYPYSWLVDANSHTLQEVYDFMGAKFADDTLDTIYRDAIEWGEDEQALMVKAGPNGYYTERNINLTEGVWITDRGAGTVAYMESDNGYDYTPPVSVTFTIANIKANSEVRIYKTSDGTELAGTEDSGTSFVYNYVHTSDTTVHIVVHHLDYQWLRINSVTLGNADQTIPIQQIPDRNYSNA